MDSVSPGSTRDFASAASAAIVEKTRESLSERGITVTVVDTRGEALERLKGLIPPGASVNTGASVSLREIGFEAFLTSGSHPWRNLKGEYLAEKDAAKQRALRRQAILADYFLGSVHAVTETGELLIASATGSQIAPYAYASSNVIWVVGSQKIVPTLEDGFRRIREYILPDEEKRMRELSGGKVGTMIGKILVFERESRMLARTLTLLLVREPVGD